MSGAPEFVLTILDTAFAFINVLNVLIANRNVFCVYNKKPKSIKIIRNQISSGHRRILEFS